MSDVNHIEVIARGVCIKESKLLVCRTKGAENTYLPGGHVEFMERAKEGLKREIEEELGMMPDVGRFLGAVEHTFIQGNEQHCEVNLVFQMDLQEIDTLDNPDSREDYIEFRWILIDNLAGARLEPAILCEKLSEWLRDPESPERWSSAKVSRATWPKRWLSCWY